MKKNYGNKEKKDKTETEYRSICLLKNTKKSRVDQKKKNNKKHITN